VEHNSACTVSKVHHICDDAKCTAGSWNAPACQPWKLENEFVCDTKGSNCEEWWSDAQMIERGYTDASGAVLSTFMDSSTQPCSQQASKVLFKSSPYDYEGSPYYDANFKGYTARKTNYDDGSPATGTEFKRSDTPKRNAPEQDPSKFVDISWMESDFCKAEAPSCIAGLNYYSRNNLCADSASGWSSSTPASACRYVQHKCDKHSIYYKTDTGHASLPLTPANILKHNKDNFRRKRYGYEYVFKKWMECKAKNVTVAVDDNSELGWDQDDADGAVGAGEPDGWDCEVEKRCVCLSCTMGWSTDEVGEQWYTGEPCNCDAVPASVQGLAAAMCAQT